MLSPHKENTCLSKNAYLCESRIPHSLLPSCLLAGLISDNSQRPPSSAALRWLRKTRYSVTSTGRAAPIAKENILLSLNDLWKTWENSEARNCLWLKEKAWFLRFLSHRAHIDLHESRRTFYDLFLCFVFITRLSFLFFMTPKEILATLIFLPSTGSGIS